MAASLLAEGPVEIVGAPRLRDIAHVREASRDPRRGGHARRRRRGRARGVEDRAGGREEGRGALRAGEDDARVGPGPRAASRPAWTGPDLPSRGLRDRRPPDRPAPAGAGAHGGEDLPLRGVHRGVGGSPFGRRRHLRHEDRHGDGEPDDGRLPRRGDDHPFERGAGARGVRPRAAAARHGGRHRGGRNRRDRGPGGPLPPRGAPRGDGGPDRGGDAPPGRRDHGRRRDGAGRGRLLDERRRRKAPEVRGRCGLRPGRGARPQGGADPLRERQDRSVPRIPHGRAGAVHGLHVPGGRIQRHFRDDLREPVHARGRTAADGGEDRRFGEHRRGEEGPRRFPGRP